MSKRFGLLLAGMMLLGVFLAACTPAGGDATEGGEVDCANEETLCIGLVTDVGQIDDKSFNQSAWEGAQAAAAALGAAEINFVETVDAKDYASNIDLFVNDGYDIIVTVGFAMGEATIAAAGNYPNVSFIGVDQFQVEPVANLAGVIFPEDKSGFLAGALAGMLTETNTIASVLGTDLVPPVVAFNEGYKAGAAFVNPDVNVIDTYHPGGLDVAFTDPEWGASTAAQAMDQGADVVFGAGGQTGNGAIIEVASNEGVFCIGVDTDQFETVPEARPCLVSSAMKLITPSVETLITDASAGNMASGNFVGPVGLAPFHDFEDQVPQEIKDRLDEIDAGLADGSITTGYGG